MSSPRNGNGNDSDDEPVSKKNKPMPTNRASHDDPELEIKKEKFLTAYTPGYIFTVQGDNEAGNECFIIVKRLEQMLSCPEPELYGGKRRTRSYRKKRSKRTVRKQRK